MEIPYFFWWLKYLVNSSKEETGFLDSLPGVIKDFKNDVPDFNKIEDTSGEVDNLLNLIIQNLDNYAETEKDVYLQEIEKISNKITPVMNDVYYNELEFFNRFTPIPEETFLMNEAGKRVDTSSLYMGLKGLACAFIEKTMEEDDLYTCLDELRNVIYDIQDGELAQLLDEADKNSSKLSSSVQELSNLFETSISNLEEALEKIERFIQNKNMEEAREGLVKAYKGLVDLNIIKLIAESRGGVK